MGLLVVPHQVMWPFPRMPQYGLTRAMRCTGSHFSLDRSCLMNLLYADTDTPLPARSSCEHSHTRNIGTQHTPRKWPNHLSRSRGQRTGRKTSETRTIQGKQGIFNPTSSTMLTRLLKALQQSQVLRPGHQVFEPQNPCPSLCTVRQIRILRQAVRP